jgi:hypothetical protein
LVTYGCGVESWDGGGGTVLMPRVWDATLCPG